MKAKSFLPTTIVISAILAQLTFAALPRYEIIDLGPGIAHGINEAGQVVGSYWSPTGEIAFMWDKSTGMMELGTLGGPWSVATAINDAGQVIGLSRTAGSENHAFLWDKTSGMIDLGTLPGYAHSRAWGINNVGQVVGDSGVTAFLWEDGNMIDLGTLGGGSSYAWAINNIGQVVGGSSSGQFFHAFLWDSINGMRDLGVLPSSYSNYSNAYGINEREQIVGISGGENVFLWEDGEMIDLGTLEQFSEFCTINDAGQVVGAAEYEEGKYYAFYWERSIGMITLDELLPTDSGWRTLCKAKDINNRCQIVGFGITEKGEEHAFLMTPVPPKIIYVDDDATGADDGSSWADAFNYLQDALTAAWDGDEIRVAQGIYKPDQGAGITPGDREATFQLINGVTLKGGYAGFGEPDPNARDVELYETILSGDLTGNDVDVNDPIDLLDDPCRTENSYHVVTGSGTGPNTVLDGFTITAGNANFFVYPTHMSIETSCGGGMYNHEGSPNLSNCEFTSNSSIRYGGAMFNWIDSNTTLTNCTFTGNYLTEFNHGNSGGAGISNHWSNPILHNCAFNGNRAGKKGSGAGMYNWDSDTILTNCTFKENSTSKIFDGGGGIYNHNSSPILTNCIFEQNSSDNGNGGGMCNGTGATPKLTNCTFTDNRAKKGGGMSNDGSNPVLTNCTFTTNSAEYSGGGIVNKWSSKPTLSNCTFSGNSADVGGAMHNDRSSPTMTDCTFSENKAGAGGGMANYESYPTLSDCIFKGNSAHGTAVSVAGGGGMDNCSSSPKLTNCTFSGNYGSGGGMSNGDGSSPILKNSIFIGNYACGMVNYDSSPILTNCTFNGNSANWYCTGIYNYHKSQSTLTNCIIWNDSNGIWNGDDSTIKITYSDVQGGWPGEGNIDSNPLFVDPGYWDANGTPDDANDDFWVDGDYHLLPGSPCIDAGDPNYIAEPNETDLDGRPRIIGGRIDMGVYETPIPAEARILPRTINLASKGKFVTCYIWLPDDYDVADIDPDGVMLERQIKAEVVLVDEHKQVATATFDRKDVQTILEVGDVELTITCQLTDGTYFEATDIIQVTDKGPK